jgi:hypothetical protein
MEKESILLDHALSMLFYRHQDSSRDAADTVCKAIREGLWFTFPKAYTPKDRRQWLKSFTNFLNIDIKNLLERLEDE